MTAFRRVALAAVVLAVAALSFGCTPEPQVVKVTPKVEPPAVATEGVLRAGVDLSQPPFAGVDESRTAGIDVDVASALAGELGLTVEFVDVKPSDAATALAQGDVDIVMSVPYDDNVLTELTMAGAYLTDAPAFFVTADASASVEPSLTLNTLTADKVAAQTESLSYWIVRQQIDPEAVAEYPTLRDALNAVATGEVSVAAGDALVGAYLLRDFPGLQFAGLLGEPTTLGVAVGAENTALGDAVTAALDELAAGGVLDTIRSKWVGDLPAIEAKEIAPSEESTPTP